jgi:predicted  nucleic acid-binding Zn-ribbon protein
MLKEDLRVLGEIQKIDKKINELQTQINDIPLKITEMDTALSSVEEDVKTDRAEITDRDQQRRALEGDLDARVGKINKYNEQLHELKTNKEYSAMLQEIAKEKQDNSVAEEKILELMERIDGLNKDLKEKEALYEEKKEASAKEKENLNLLQVNLKKQITELSKEKTEMSLRVDKKLFNRYENILTHKKDKIAITPVKEGVCQGCSIKLPPEVVNKAINCHEIIICDTCARILYYEDEAPGKEREQKTEGRKQKTA